MAIRRNRGQVTRDKISPYSVESARCERQSRSNRCARLSAQMSKYGRPQHL